MSILYLEVFEGKLCWDISEGETLLETIEDKGLFRNDLLLEDPSMALIKEYGLELERKL